MKTTKLSTLLLLLLSNYLIGQTNKVVPWPEVPQKPYYYDTETNNLIQLDQTNLVREVQSKGYFVTKNKEIYYCPNKNSRVKLNTKPKLHFVIDLDNGTDVTKTLKFLKFELNEKKQRRELIVSSETNSTFVGTVDSDNSIKDNFFTFKKIREVDENSGRTVYLITIELTEKGEYGIFWFGGYEECESFSLN